MKSKKWIFISITVVLFGIFCAFKLVPSVRLSEGEKNVFDVSYTDAQVNEGTLKITVNYGSKGIPFEIGKDIIVSTNKEFTNTLRMINCIPEGDNYVYQFSAVNLGNADTVYIQPPILYVPIETEPCYIKASAGETMTKTCSEGTEMEEWFSIESIDIEESSEGLYFVNIEILAKNKDLPRFPKLCVGEERYGGLSSLNLNEENCFESGEFQLYLLALNEEDAYAKLEEAVLLVQDALVRVDADEMTFLSNIKEISVVRP